MMLQQLMEDTLPSAQGRVIVVLEGGYNLQSISNSAVACLHVLTGTKHYKREKVEMPTVEGLAAIEATIDTGPIWRPLYKHNSPNIIKIPDRKLLLKPMVFGDNPLPKK